MSIIERALAKFQGSRPSTSRAPRASGEQLVPRSPRPGGAARRSLSDVGRGEQYKPRETVTVDFGALRAAGILPPDERSSDALTHEIRRIKWPLLESAAARATPEAPPANLIMVTSSVAGEGKTFTSINLALSLAREEDSSVLLVDADVARRHTTRLFGLEERAGLTDALADATVDPHDLVVGTGITGFCVFPSGRRASGMPELFASQRMTDIVRALGARDPRQIILFDSSPLLATSEAQVLGRSVDQIVLVVRAESTTQPMVLEAISLLDKSKQIRCILNQSRMSRLMEYYYYPYGQQAQD